MQTATPGLSLVRPETRVLAYLAKWGLRAVFLLGVMVALASQATAAPVVFEASGKFYGGGGAVLSGTLTIDTATGKVLSADLSVTANSVVLYVFDRNISISVTHRYEGNLTSIVIREATTDDFPQLCLVVKESTLVGYKGSPLVSDLLPAEDGSGSCILLGIGIDYIDVLPLSSGSLEPN